MKRLKHHQSLTDKRCSRCQDVKLLDAFDRNRSRPDGFDHFCRECRKLYRAELTRAKQEAAGPWVQFNGQWHLYSGTAAWASDHGLVLVHGPKPDADQATTPTPQAPDDRAASAEAERHH